MRGAERRDGGLRGWRRLCGAGAGGCVGRRESGALCRVDGGGRGEGWLFRRGGRPCLFLKLFDARVSCLVWSG